MKKIIIVLFFAIFLASCSEKNLSSSWTWNISTNTWKILVNEDKTILYDKNLKEMNTNKKLENWDVVAFLKTTKWQIEIFLETKKAPITTANFIGLVKKWYYNGITFHRIIKNFMIQGWDPTWTWAWWESIYWEKFKDEFHADLKNNTYTISMANAWKDTNWSQFFINVADNNFLDFKHSVFWTVIWWKDNVLNISKVKTWANDKPEKEIKIISAEVKEYKDGKFIDYNFDEKKSVSDYKNAEKEKQKSPIKSGDNVSVHYTWTFENGEKFDSSYDRKEPITFEVWSWMMIKGFDEAVVWMKVWEKKSITLSPDKAYWEYDKSKVQVIEKSKLKDFENAWIKLEKWEDLPTQFWSFPIIESTKDSITVDLNSKMAWKTLKFDIEIVKKN